MLLSIALVVRHHGSRDPVRASVANTLHNTWLRGYCFDFTDIQMSLTGMKSAVCCMNFSVPSSKGKLHSSCLMTHFSTKGKIMTGMVLNGYQATISNITDEERLPSTRSHQKEVLHIKIL